MAGKILGIIAEKLVYVAVGYVLGMILWRVYR
jgi:hypothetical protein